MPVTKLNHCQVSSFEYPMPEGFKDDSYGNDLCASIISNERKLKIFIDHKKPENREDPSLARFSIFETDEDGETEGFIMETEEYGDVLNYLKRT